MPKTEAHFDVPALLGAVQAQDVGLSVTTNNPPRFRAILYAAMRADESLRCFIYAKPNSPSGFYLLKQRFLGPAEPLSPEDMEEQDAA